MAAFHYEPIARSQKPRRWGVWFPLFALFATVLLYCLTIPKLPFASVWSHDHNQTEASMMSEHDFTVRLHPADHINRAPRTTGLDWKITQGERRPDGVLKEVFLVNGEFLAPPLEARSGDELIITVYNQLHTNESVAIHWHGLHVSNDVDGAAGVTQCPIAPTEKLQYKIQIPEDQSGTFWYHAHFETQRADGLFGALIVHKPAEQATEVDEYQYEEDQVLVIGDWYHQPAHEVLEYYDSWKNFKIEPAPDSILLNGMGKYNCSKAVPARPVNCTDIEVPSLHLAEERTRLRIINTGAITGFSLSMDGYSITLIEVDGGGKVATQSPVQAIGVLYPGERMDMIVRKTATPNDEPPRFSIALDRETMQFPNLALTPIQHFPISQPPKPKHLTARASTPEGEQKKLDLTTITGAALAPNHLPSKPDQTLLLYTTIAYLAQNQNRPKGMLNRTSWAPPPSPQLPLLALSRSDWNTTSSKPFIPVLPQNEWVDLVINNMDDKGHPFHLHGHDFYVLATHQASRMGEYAAYNPYVDGGRLPGGKELDLVGPRRKDTVYVPSQGFVVLRFKAEREGLWMLHCHVLWHQSVGMGMALQVGESEELKAAALKTCPRAK